MSTLPAIWLLWIRRGGVELLVGVIKCIARGDAALIYRNVRVELAAGFMSDGASNRNSGHAVA